MKKKGVGVHPHPHVENVVMNGRHTGLADNDKDVYNPFISVKIQRLR